jgi:phage replication initiation protein
MRDTPKPSSSEAIQRQYDIHSVKSVVSGNSKKKTNTKALPIKTGLRSFTSNAYGLPVINKNPAATLFEHEEFPLPPSCNTGALTQPPLENRSLIDWFAFTCFVPSAPRSTDCGTDGTPTVFELIGIAETHFTKMSVGGKGYKACSSYGNIRIYSDGSPGMGVHVEMTGSGCREFEQFHDSKNPWPALWAEISNHQFDNPPLYNITRLDIANDVVDGKLPLLLIKEAISHGETRSRFKGGHCINKFTLGAVEYTHNAFHGQGETIYLGSLKSRLQIRFYDKAAEQGLVGVSWVRCELQLRDERAAVALSLLVADECIGKVAAGILNNYISFIDRTHTRSENCPLKSWWAVWLDTTAKLQLTLVKKMTTLFDTINHLKTQYAPTLAMLWEMVGVTNAMGVLENILVDGCSRFTAKHERILAYTKATCLISLPITA